ncbi:hypothetical protein [Streptomyces sp900129855]|uniref:Uncharacterized protein n=1 Tax=Streptomyces sp. 900129855 TaxID=3155129 RepID=A0ABV2ZSC7_9ACTN
MGERLNDGAGLGRRRAHPDDAVADLSGLEALLAHALREPGDRPNTNTNTSTSTDIGMGTDVAGGSEGELRAVAAFRAARDSGAHRARPRRRDDWRPRPARRHTARSLRVTLSALIAALALGGVAYAAIGSVTDGGGDDGGGRPERSASAPSGRSDTPSGAPSATDGAERDRPANAKDTEAHCRAYEKVQGRGQAMDSTAWQRLVTAAGGEQNVAAYCAAHAQQKAEKTPKAEKSPKAEKTPKADTGPKAETNPKAETSPRADQSPKAEKTVTPERSANSGKTRAANGG